MENATKALLIAAAVLIAIIIISFGLTVVRQGQQSVQDADLSEAEATTFNSKFTSYEGTNVSTSKVNAMLQTVFTHNSNQTAEGSTNYVSVTGSVVSLNSTDTAVNKLSGNSYYKVTCSYSGSLINSIAVEPIN